MKTFNEVWPTVPGRGWLSENEGRLLWETAAKCSGAILEVGCYAGKSTVLLAGLGRTVYSVDPFDGFDDTHSGDEIEAVWKANILERGISNVVLSRCKIADWTIRPVGFAYLDGDHTYWGTVEQIETAKLCGASLFCVHDWATSGGGKEIVDAVTDYGGIQVLQVVERMAVCQIKGG